MPDPDGEVTFGVGFLEAVLRLSMHLHFGAGNRGELSGGSGDEAVDVYGDGDGEVAVAGGLAAAATAAAAGANTRPLFGST
jgi:hypothetical protein